MWLADTETRKALRHAAVVFLGFTAFFTLFFAPAVFSGRLLMTSSDSYLYHYPALFGGRALWDPLLFSGYPRFADPQVMLWYPLALPLSLTGWEWLWNPFLLAPYILGSCFTYGLIWRLTRSRLAALVAGPVFGLSGFLMAHMCHVALIHAAAWLPLILWSLEELRQRWHRGWFTVLALAVANCLLAGHVQVFVNSLALGGLYVAWHLPGAPAGWWRYGLSCATGVALGLGLSAVQLLPTAELAPHSERARMSFEDFTSHSLPRRQLSLLVFPYVTGGANPAPGTWLATDARPERAKVVPYFGGWNFGEVTGYCGLLSLVLALSGLLGGWRSRLAWFWALTAVAAVVLALGDSTPVARWLYHVPVFNLFRCPARFLMWFALAVAVLTGLGVRALQTLPRRRATRLLSVASVAVMVGVGIAWLGVRHQMAHAELFQNVPTGARSSLPWKNLALGMPLGVLLAGLPLLWAWHVRRGRLLGAALLSAVVADLALFAWFTGWVALSVPAGTLGRPPEVVAELAHDLKHKGERLLSTLVPSTLEPNARSLPMRLDAAPVNLSSRWGIANARGYTPLALQRYTQLVPHAVLSLDGKCDELFALRYLVSPVRTRRVQDVSWDEHGLLAPYLGGGGAGVSSVSFPTPLVSATRIALMADVGGAAGLPDGYTVAELVVQTPSGSLPPIPLRMGEHLTECRREQAATRPHVRHKLPCLTEAAPCQDESGRTFQAHHSIANVSLGCRTAVNGVQLRWVDTQGAGVLRPLHLTVIDDVGGTCLPVCHTAGASDHWRVRAVLPDGSHTVLENRRPLRRAWLVSQVVRLSADEMAQTLLGAKRLPDGSPFETYRTALVEEAIPFTGGPTGSADEAHVTSYRPQRVRVATRAAGETLLVLGDVHYPGWEARIDGRPTRIYRTDSVLRGVVVPPGEHVVEFVFRPWSLYLGLIISGVSVIVIVVLLKMRQVLTFCRSRRSGPRPG